MENKLPMLLRLMQKWLLWLGELGEDVTVGIPVGFFCLVKEFEILRRQFCGGGRDPNTHQHTANTTETVNKTVLKPPWTSLPTTLNYCFRFLFTEEVNLNIQDHHSSEM